MTSPDDNSYYIFIYFSCCYTAFLAQFLFWNSHWNSHENKMSNSPRIWASYDKSAWILSSWWSRHLPSHCIPHATSRAVTSRGYVSVRAVQPLSPFIIPLKHRDRANPATPDRGGGVLPPCYPPHIHCSSHMRVDLWVDRRIRLKFLWGSITQICEQLLGQHGSDAF